MISLLYVVFNLGDGTEKHVLCEFVATKNTDMSTVFTGTAGVFDVTNESLGIKVGVASSELPNSSSTAGSYAHKNCC